MGGYKQIKVKKIPPKIGQRTFVSYVSPRDPYIHFVVVVFPLFLLFPFSFDSFIKQLASFRKFERACGFAKKPAQIIK